MKKERWAASFAVLLWLTACAETPLPIEPEDPEDPVTVDECARLGACEVRGVDLVIDELALALPASHPIDPATLLPWVQTYDSVPVRYRIRNRGDAPAPASSGWLVSCTACTGAGGRTLQIRALDPGAVDSGVANVPALSVAGGATPVLNLDGVNAIDEPFYRNNSRTASGSFLTVIPDVRGTMQILSPEVRVGAPLRVALTVRNQAQYGVQRDTSLALCFRRPALYSSYLDGCYADFAVQTIPALPPGAQWSDTVEVTLSPSNYPYEKHNLISMQLDACLGGMTTYVEQPCLAGSNVVLHPNVESACAIPALAPGVAVQDSFPGLGGTRRACYVYLAQFVVYSFEGTAGSTYHVQLQVPGITDVSIWDRNGVQVGSGADRAAQATINATGRHYVVLRRSNLDRAAFTLLLSSQ
jgi:hypothetical protein